MVGLISRQHVLGPCDRPVLKYEATYGVGAWPFTLLWTLVPDQGPNITVTSTTVGASRDFDFEYEEVSNH